jgi:hypothetical protein
MACGDSRVGRRYCLPIVRCDPFGHSFHGASGLFAIGVYGAMAPFGTLPNEFPTGFPVASGIALICTHANAGSFFGDYASGLIRQRTGSLLGEVILAGIALIVLATLVLLLPRKEQ